jgi:hypothetical protein
MAGRWWIELTRTLPLKLMDHRSYHHITVGNLLSSNIAGWIQINPARMLEMIMDSEGQMTVESDEID